MYAKAKSIESIHLNVFTYKLIFPTVFFMKSRFLFVFLLVVLLLNGCATRPPPPERVETNALQQKLDQFNAWQLRGRLAFKSEQEKFSANLNWQQIDDTYQVKLTSFIGTTLLEMQGAPGEALILADDQEYRDIDGQRLIHQITGWNIPINKLPLWIKGQFAPGDAVIFDKQGLVQTLTTGCLFCDRWKISFQKYQQLDDLWLPHQVTLVNQDAPDNQIKIRINTWKKT